MSLIHQDDDMMLNSTVRRVMRSSTRSTRHSHGSGTNSSPDAKARYSTGTKGGSSSEIQSLGMRRVTNVDITKAVRKAQNLLRKSALAHSDSIIEKKLITEALQESHSRWAGCLMMPITVLSFFFYTWAALLTEDITLGHLIESPVRDRLVPDIDEGETPDATALQGVTTIPDVWEYLDRTYLPLFFRQNDTLTGKPLPRDEWGQLFLYNQVQGVALLELQRSVKEKCGQGYYAYTSHAVCYPQNKLSDEPFGKSLDTLPDVEGRTAEEFFLGGTDPVIACEGEGFTVPGCSQRRLAYLPQVLNSGRYMPGAGEDDQTFRFVLDGQDPYWKLQQRLRYLQTRGWLDDQATRLTVRVVYLNQEFEVPRLEQVVIRFFFTRGGGVFSQIHMRNLILQMIRPDRSQMLVAWGLFTITLGISTWFVIRDLAVNLKQCALRQHFNGATIMVWVTVVWGWGNIMGLIVSEFVLAQKLEDSLVQYLEDRTQANALHLHDVSDEFESFVSTLRQFIAWAHLLFMMRCFSALQYQPRLAVVTRTLTASAVDMLHFMLVLFPTFFAFAYVGLVLFGRRQQDFATEVSAINTCFKIMMESEFKWLELSEQNYALAFLWVAIYNIIVVLILLNMVLAIIMDVYQEIRQDSGDSMTILTDLKYIYHRIRFYKEWMPEKELLEEFQVLPEMMLVEDIREAFPDMHMYQLNYIIMDSRNKAKAIGRVGIHPGYTQEMVAAIQISLEEILQDLDTLKKKGWLCKGLEVGDGSARESVKEILTSIAVQSHWTALLRKNIQVLFDEINKKPNSAAKRKTAKGAKALDDGVETDEDGRQVDDGKPEEPLLHGVW